jgi:hypothetical protein
VLLPSDTHKKPITSITAVLLRLMTYLLILSRSHFDYLPLFRFLLLFYLFTAAVNMSGYTESNSR